MYNRNIQIIFYFKHINDNILLISVFFIFIIFIFINLFYTIFFSLSFFFNFSKIIFIFKICFEKHYVLYF